MNLDLDSRDRARILGVAVLLAVLAAGLFAGAALTVAFRSPGRVVEHERRLKIGGPSGIPGDHERVMFMREPFGAGLDLTPDQRERVDSLMAEQARKAERLMADMEPRMKALMDSTNAAIEEVLTAEQRERFREMQAQRRDVIVERFRTPVPPAERPVPPAARPEPPAERPEPPAE
jgi:Spy/CpxP family protein refolding chaperone